MQRRVNYQELDRAWKKLSERKAMGPDNLPNRMLMEGYSVTRDTTLELYNTSWITEYTPVTWRMATYSPSLKPHKEDHIPTDYRPLMLSAQLGRTLAGIVADRFLTHCSSHNKFQLKYWNNAFQPNKSIDDIATSITQDGYYALHKQLGINVVTADISGAYDSIHIESLIHKLYHNFNIR